VTVPRHGKEREQVNQGETPQAWQDQPAKRRQKDTDARWTMSTFAPRFLLYLRIKHLITQLPARLNTGPVASDYPDGIRTR
jgi:hypothetical protein